jgi:hypothetical protein
MKVVKFLHQVDRFALCADDDSIGCIKSLRAPSRRNRVAPTSNSAPVPVAAFDRFRDFFTGFYRHGAISNHPILGQDTGDFARDFLDETQSTLPSASWRMGTAMKTTCP